MRYVIAVICFTILSGCATVFSGYESEVLIHNCPDSLRIYTSDGIEHPKSYTQTKFALVRRPDSLYISHEMVDSAYCSIELRSNKDHIVVFRAGNAEYRYPVYAKLSGWWFALDLICGGIPATVDWLTGNWNYYDPIEFKK